MVKIMNSSQDELHYLSAMKLEENFKQTEEKLWTSDTDSLGENFLKRSSIIDITVYYESEAGLILILLSDEEESGFENGTYNIYYNDKTDKFDIKAKEICIEPLDNITY
ncbi:hypothetical protein TKK_0002005 [Trichogramma kaykai]